jgi:hypothetical protein
MSKNLKFLWLIKEENSEIQAKFALLKSLSYSPTLVYTLAEIEASLLQGGTSCLLISEQGEPKEIQSLILELNQLPTARNLRKILVLETFHSKTIFYAACSNFRDMLPLFEDSKTWQDRLTFSLASAPLTFPEPIGQVTLNSIAKVLIPCRVIWLGEQEVRLETSLESKVGQELSLSGPLLQRIGLSFATAHIRKVDHHYLKYRFSSAVDCEWNLREGAGKLSEVLAGKRFKRPFRLYLVARDRELRKDLLTRFNPSEFEVHTAVQLQSISAEVDFFSPDMIFIEAHFCQGKFTPLFM